MAKLNGTIANASSEFIHESNDIREPLIWNKSIANTIIPFTQALSNDQYVFGVTFRPCENKVVSLSRKRQPYIKYKLEDQKQILLNNIAYWDALCGLKFQDVHFEITQVQGKDVMHFHSFMICENKPSRYCLLEAVDKMNKLYGPKTYTSCKVDSLCTNDDIYRWSLYIRKDIKHSPEVWTKGI